jgi:flavodoxin
MELPDSMSRRKLLTASALLSLTTGMTASDSSAAARRRSGERTLVAYFSRTGNTRVIAGQIQRALSADLFEIQPAEAYPEDYEETVEQARRERDTAYEPPLKASVPDLAAYKTVLLGFPIWGETAPPVIRSFLSAHDLQGKTLIPFITHGGYGLGNSFSVLARHSPKARLLDGFSMQASQERETLSRVTRWLGEIQLND